MGRLRYLTIVLTLGSWGMISVGAPPDDAAPAAAPTARPAPPAPPSEYIKAGAWLLKNNDTARAAQYLKAAEDYQDLLSAEDRAKLAQLKAQLNQAPAAPTPAPAALEAQAPVVEPMSDQGMPLGDDPAAATTTPSGLAGGQPAGAELRGRPQVGDKQSGRWLLRQAREHIALGQLDAAQQKVAEARALNVRWGLFDDTPDRVEADLAKARARIPASASGGGQAAGDRDQAKAKIKQARAAIEAGRLDEAEAIALEVASWNVRYGMFEDNPEKVLSAVRALRRRDVARRDGVNSGASQDHYAVLVQEARAALAAGRLDEAEQKALRAQGLNVVPAITADRAEMVLADIANARAAGAAPVVETASAKAEREGNELLAAGRRDEAAAKFLEAERLRLRESGAGAAPLAADPQVIQAQNVDGAQAPVLAPAAPADPAAGPVLALQPEPVPAAPTAEPASPGQAQLEQARALMAAGQFGEARQLAEQAKASGTGVEAEADDLLAQIALASQGGALKLYEAALDALRKGDQDRAKALLTEIAATENQDEALLQKAQDLLARMPGEGPGRATLGAVDDAEAVKAQKLNVEVGTKVAEARRMLETDPDKAIASLEQTLSAVKAADVNESARKTMVRRLEVALELARKDKVAFDRKMQDKQYRAEIEAKRLRILEADKAKLKQVEELMTKATEAKAQGNYAEAEQLARRVIEIDPNNVAATALASVARIQRHYERDKQILSDKGESTLEAFQQVDEAGIAPVDVQRNGISFPKSFADLTRSRRELAARTAPRKDAKTLAIEAKLNEPVTLNMEKETPLREVVDFLRNYTGINFVVESTALAEEGLTLDTPVQLVAKDIKLRTALKFLLGPLHLTYKIDEDAVLITSPQATRTQTYAIAYPVGDLVVSPHRTPGSPTEAKPMNGIMPPGTVMDLNDPAAMNSAASQVNAQNILSGATPTGAMSSPTGVTTSTGDRTGNIDFEPLIQLIKASVAPGTWKDGPEYADGGAGGFGLGADAGGALGAQQQAVGSITPFFLNISLIIRHTSEVHDEIVDLLRQLRRLQDLQISVEVRFITVTDSFFEQIGVDFDFAVQSDVVGRKSSFAINNPAAVPSATTGGATTGGGGTTAGVAPYLINPIRDHAYGARQPLTVGTAGPTTSVVNPNFTQNLMIPFLQDSFSAITPFNATATNTGATFGLAFLSDLEVYFFLQAVQGDTRNNLVQAPKVTTFNGAPASVFNFIQRNFVGGLIPIVGAGAVAFQPIILPFPDGVQLFVTPVVSADRRYVRLTLSPVFQNLLGFDTFTIPAAVGGGGLGGNATNVNAQVQLPQFSVTQIQTTVTVPDGGTVLLGGVKRMQEQRQEFGVPVLAKTPLINRLFRNIGIGRTTDSLMLMVTPRIIILEEEEEKLGIPPAQNVTF